MYKIMLVDDEGIVIDSLKFIIEKNFGKSCQVESAKTGRAAIELADSFRPDIVFMDIQMPGINGIEAMKEIKSRDSSIIFVVLSAYDRFNYAKQAIDLGVVEYLMKPFNSSKIIEVLKKAISRIDSNRKKISNDLEIREKLKTVVPVLENGFVHTLIFQDPSKAEVQNYKNLLGLEENYGYIMIMEYGDDRKDGELTNPVGASVRIQKVYDEIRDTIKEFFNAQIGTPMANRIAMYVPYREGEMDYNARIEIIENARVLTRRLAQQSEMKFKIGIGSLKPIEEIQKSYHEAVEAVRSTKGKVTHIQDIALECQYEEEYPIELEKGLFATVGKGNVGLTRNYANRFFDWMIQENESDMDSLRARFVDKVSQAAENMYNKEGKQVNGLVDRACAYIKENFCKDLSLDDVSREINISPYYFSKLFKEEMGENFVEYVTKVRMEHAKELLKKQEFSIKEICVNCGYSDPNYFSRIFKKTTGVTPSEYREGGVGL